MESRWESHLAAYREACPDIEPTAGFMPTLWERIEAKQNYSRRVMTLARRFVTAAGCVCALLTGLLFYPHPAPVSHSDALPYVDALAEYQAAHSLTELENLPVDVQNGPQE